MSIRDIAISAGLEAIEEALAELLERHPDVDPDLARALQVAMSHLRDLAEGGTLTSEDLDEVATAIDDAIDLDDLLPPPVGGIAELADWPVIRWVLGLLERFGSWFRADPAERAERRAERAETIEAAALRLDGRAALAQAASQWRRCERLERRADRKRRRVERLKDRR